MPHSVPTLPLASDQAAAGDRTDVLRAAFLAIFLGVTLVAGAGFAGPEILHNAAHDSRHSLAFPCH